MITSCSIRQYNMILGWIWDDNIAGPERQKQYFALYLLQIKRFRWIMKLDHKLKPKSHPKLQKWSHRRPRAGVCAFGRVLGSYFFGGGGERPKSRVKTWDNLNHGCFCVAGRPGTP